MNMKRLLLSIICCSPLLFSPSASLSVDLTGPSDQTLASFEQYGPVSPAETLWAISSKLRPDKSVSVQQTLVAIYKTNPFAFYKGNINQIIPESIIKVPSFEFVAQQTDKEAMDLIRKYSAKKKNVVKKETLKIPEKVTEKTVEKIIDSAPVESVLVKTIDPAIVVENEANKEKLLVAENKLSELQAEMQVLNEQFIVATEATQALKLKLQPLSDEISTLTEHLVEEAVIQEKLQKIIDDYRTQLDLIEVSPFSGDGIINETLRLFTSSMTNLLIVIISPLILLLLIFVVISRIRTKRLLAEQEQELAESTVTLMEESGKFDELLTEDLSNNDEQELDITTDSVTSEPEKINIDELTLPDDLEEIDLNDDQELGVVDLTEDDELITSEDDPFGIGALTDDEDLVSSIDLDADELETSKDDPFGIAASTESDEEISSINLDEVEPETSEDDPFGINALANDETLISSTDSDKVISVEEQADLDLAAEWEAQISSESVNDSADSNDVVDESESVFDTTAISTEDELDREEKTEKILSNNELSELDSLEAIGDSDGLEIVDQSEATVLDISELDVQEEGPSLDIDALDVLDENEANVLDLSELDISEQIPSLDMDTLETIDENQTDVLDISELDVPEEGPSLDIDALEMLDENEVNVLDLSELDISEEIPSLDIDALDIQENSSSLDVDVPEMLEESETDGIKTRGDQDLLAQQLSDVAFNEEVPLPKVDRAGRNDFIDIETLLENSDVNDKDEPYSELELDLGLEEFPDVVDLQESVDIDDDENGIGAQLDLARAYLEIDDQAGAKEILMSVVEDSNGKQRVEIDKLLSRLK
jgi:pilus assembly protein FimV